MGLWTTPFQNAVDQATSENTVSGQQNMEVCLEVADFIKGKQVGSKEALKYLRKRVTNKNPNVQLLSLNLIDICAKNCGQHFLVELASRDFLSLIPEVRMKMIELLQIWGLTFKQRPELGYMTESYESLKLEGLLFPPAPKIDMSILETTTAPEWSDSDTCSRCKLSFSITNRKHHCRNCGKTFCSSCSSQSLPLPEFGINHLVRVCDGCYTTRVTRLREGIAKTSHKGTADVTDKELQMAIQLSLEESFTTDSKSKSRDFDDDPMLAAAIAASLKESEVVAKERPKLYSSLSASSSVSPSPVQSSVKIVKETAKNDISETEKENIRLFHQLMVKMNRGNESVYSNQQIQKLYSDLSIISTKIHGFISQESLLKSNMEVASRKISEAMKKYDWLLEERSKRYSATPAVYHQQVQQPAYQHQSASHQPTQSAYQFQPSNQSIPQPAFQQTNPATTQPAYQQPVYQGTQPAYRPPISAVPPFQPAPYTAQQSTPPFQPGYSQSPPAFAQARPPFQYEQSQFPQDSQQANWSQPPVAYSEPPQAQAQPAVVKKEEEKPLIEF